MENSFKTDIEEKILKVIIQTNYCVKTIELL